MTVRCPHYYSNNGPLPSILFRQCRYVALNIIPIVTVRCPHAYSGRAGNRSLTTISIMAHRLPSYLFPYRRNRWPHTYSRNDGTSPSYLFPQCTIRCPHYLSGRGPFAALTTIPASQERCPHIYSHIAGTLPSYLFQYRTLCPYSYFRIAGTDGLTTIPTVALISIPIMHPLPSLSFPLRPLPVPHYHSR